MKYLKFLLATIGMLILALIPSCSRELTGVPFLSTTSENVQRLEPMIQTLERLKVTQFRNNDWCKNFFYARGKFSSLPHNWTCNLSVNEAQPFSSQSEQDFHTIERALADTGLRVYLTVADFDAHTRIRYAEFHLDCFFCRTRYVYDPGYDKLPEDIPDELEHEAINSDWYLVNEDWN